MLDRISQGVSCLEPLRVSNYERNSRIPKRCGLNKVNQNREIHVVLNYGEVQ